jgi:tripartite-type tricarboxylate transporter receptor subunit TctC
MLALSKSRGLSFASAGAATPGHLSGELLKLRTKSNLTHVPYNGAGPALNDILGGHVDMFFSGFPPTVPHVKAGTMRLLAVSTAKRSSVAPDVPTVAEASGIKDFDIALWQGFFAPRGTPQEVVARLHAEINKLLAQNEIKSKLLAAGAEVTTISIDAFAAFTKAESAKFLRIIRDGGLKPE